MELKEIIQSKEARQKMQLGVMPTIVGAIFAHGPEDLIGAYGFPEVIAVLSALIAVQVYLIAARIQFDFRGAA